MKENKLISAMDFIDEKYMQEAITYQKPAIRHTISKRGVALLVAAVLVIVLAVGAYASYNYLLSNPKKPSFPVTLGSLHPGITQEERRLFEISQQYDISLVNGFIWTTDYNIEYIGDYYYEYGVASTPKQLFMFFFTNDPNHEVRLEGIQYLKNGKTYEVEHEFVKDYGDTVVIMDVPRGWEICGRSFTFYCEAVEDNVFGWGTGSGITEDQAFIDSYKRKYFWGNGEYTKEQAEKFEEYFLTK